MVMKKGKYLVLGLFPIAISSLFLKGNAGGVNVSLPSIPFGSLGDVEDFSGALMDQSNETSPEGDVVEQLVLASADTREVIGILEKLTGRTALIEQKLPTNKISIDIHEPISRIEAISAIESVLNLNGVAVVDMGEKFIKLVSLKSSITQSPDIVDQSLLSFEPSQRICSKFFKLRYLDAGEFQKTVKSILTPSTSNIINFTSSNALFITDTMANLQNVENLIRLTDIPIQMTELVNFIPMNNVKASAVVKKFDQLKRGTLKKYLSTITIDCDDTSNQLIVIAPQENFAIIQNIAKQLDNRCELLLKSEVIRVKHGDSKKSTDIVSGIVKEQRSRIEKENKMAFERQQAQMTAQGSLANALAQAASGSRSNQQISNT
jgi:general secretion pathway protein D